MPKTKVAPKVEEGPRINPLAGFTELALICNINKEPNPLQFRTYHGPYLVESPGPDEEYALTPIEWVKAYKDMGEISLDPHAPDARSEFIIGANDIANDLCRELSSNMVGPRSEVMGGAFWGAFVCKSAEKDENGDFIGPSPEELKDAKVRLTRTMNLFVQAADIDWARFKRPDFVSDTARVAVRYLGLEREWAYIMAEEAPAPVLLEKKECPACGGLLPNPHAVICIHCKSIIGDPEKARAFGHVSTARTPAPPPVKQ